MIQQLYIVDKDNSLTLEIKKLFKDDYHYKFKYIGPDKIEILLKDIPDIVIINEDNIEMETTELCNIIRNNADTNITPILVLSSNEEKEHKLDIIKNSVEYFVEKSMGEKYLQYTIKNMARLLSVNRTVSPLTGLPRKCKNSIRAKKKIA